MYIHEGTVDGDVFHDFGRKTLLPTMQSFNVTNNCSVVLFTINLDWVQYIIASSDALICFLPLCTPNFIPLEKAFSKLNTFFKLMNTTSTISSPRLLIAMGICKC